MWMGKFLDLEEDIKDLKSKIKKDIFKDIKKSKLTPLEFTIIETIFNSQYLSGYDLILNLNKQFAGTWEAQSGTIYPILAKLKRDGYLSSKAVKSPMGPIKNVYNLTEAGEEILKSKVNKNFHEQLKFIENFILELASVYIHSFPQGKQSELILDIQTLLKELNENIIKSLPDKLEFKSVCSNCGNEIERIVAFCPLCGASQHQE